MKKMLLVLFLAFAGLGVLGQQSMNYKLTNVKGGKKKLNQFKGKVVYVDLWAGWCAPCIASMPSLTSLQQEFGNDLQIVTINLDDSKRKFKKKYKQHRPAGTALWGGKGGLQSKFAKSMYVGALPRYILIDKNGDIADALAPGPYQVKQQIRDLIEG